MAVARRTGEVATRAATETTRSNTRLTISRNLSSPSGDVKSVPVLTSSASEDPTLGDPFLPLALPVFDEKGLEEIREVLASGWIPTGPKAKQLEQEHAPFLGAKPAVAVSSCTAAMHLTL